MAATDFQLRFLVDWDNNSWVPSGTVTGEPLNIWPGPAYGGMPKFMLSDPATNDPTAGTPAGVTPESTDYGLIRWYPGGTTERFLSLGGSCDAQGDPFLGRADLTAGSTYVFNLWGRGTVSGTENHRLRVDFYDSGMTHVSGTVSSSFTWTTDWAQQSFTFTAAGTADLAVFSVERESGESYEYYDITGMMLTAGTTVPTQYNTGSTLEQYEDVTSFVLSADWDMGRNDPLGNVCYDGQLEITLNNADKRFSPRGTAGVLYGYHLPGLRVAAEMWDGSDWTRLYSGFVHEYRVTSGTNKARQATIVARQGMERWGKDFVGATDYTSATAGQLLAEVFDKRGWATPTNTMAWVLGQSRLGIDTFLTSGSAAFNTLDSGATGGGTYTQLDQTGLSSEQSVQKAIRVIMEDENGDFWCDRNGRLTFRERGWFDAASVGGGTVDAGDTFESAGYVYGKDVIERVTVDYDQWAGYPLVASYAVNDNSSNVNVAASGTYTWNFEHEFSNPGLTTITKISNNLGRTNPLQELDCYDATESWVGGQFDTVGADDCTSTYFGVWSMSIADGTVTVQVVNDRELSTPPFTPLEGQYRLWEIRVLDDTFTSTSYDASAEGTASYPLSTTWQFNARLMTTEAQVSAWADRWITGYSQPRGEFNEVEWTTGKNDSGTLPVADIERLRDWTLGTLCVLDDTQTGEDDQTHVVIAEKHSYRPKNLQSRYTLRNIQAFRS